MTIHWQGVFPVLTIKLKPDFSLDEDAIRAGTERLIENGVAGIVALGMVGENAQLARQERHTAIRLIHEAAAGRVPVIAGVAETSTDRAVAAARKAVELGAAGLMVFPGLTYKSDADETVAFYHAVAEATELPIMLYNNPRGYGVDITPDVVERLLAAPTIVAIKEESYDTTRVTDLIARFGERLHVICGVDDLVLESAALGVKAWVSGMANAVPKASVDLLNLAMEDDFARARRLYQALIPLYHLDTVVKLVQHIKLAEHIIVGTAETVKPPRLNLRGAEREKTIAIVRQTMAELQALGY